MRCKAKEREDKFELASSHMSDLVSQLQSSNEQISFQLASAQQKVSSAISCRPNYNLNSCTSSAL